MSRFLFLLVCFFFSTQALAEGGLDTTGDPLPISVGGTRIMQVTSTGVGIGNTDPQAVLDVTGGVKIGGADLCDAERAGTIRWTGADFQGCNGSSWVSLTTAAKTTIWVSNFTTAQRCSVVCPNGMTIVTGGCEGASSGRISKSRPLGASGGAMPSPVTGWECERGDGTVAFLACYAKCER